MDSLYVYVALGAVLAAFVQGLSGFGFGLVAMAFWSWVLDPRLAAVLVVYGSLQGQILSAATVRPRFDLALLAPYLIGALAGIPVGVYLLPMLDMLWLKTLLGTLLVLWCPLMLVNQRLPRSTKAHALLIPLLALWAACLAVLAALQALPMRFGANYAATPKNLPAHWCSTLIWRYLWQPL